MTKIKKVEVVPLDINYGKIIDSFNTSDNKTQNAPSINIVETALNTKANSNDVDDLLSYKFDKSAFEVLTGSGTTPSVGYYEINYPEGFTKNNCVVISCMISTGGDYQVFPSLTETTDPNTQTYYAPQYYVYLGNKIEIRFDIAETTFSYKIVLMKIS